MLEPNLIIVGTIEWHGVDKREEGLWVADCALQWGDTASVELQEQQVERYVNYLGRQYSFNASEVDVKNTLFPEKTIGDDLLFIF